MEKMLLFPVGTTPACQYAAEFLKKQGFSLVDHPTPEVTHLLLDIPTFDSQGNLRSGSDIRPLLQMLPERITVIGGNLNHPALSGYRVADLLADPDYLAQNGAITADCALRVAAGHLTTTFRETPVLVLGWGRIGKCLSRLLQNVGAKVTVAARKASDRAMIKALGLDAVEISAVPKVLPQYRLLFNTVPELLFSKEVCSRQNDHCVKIELASEDGMAWEDVITARGLPGKYAPESSGNLIGQTIVTLYQEGNL